MSWKRSKVILNWAAVEMEEINKQICKAKTEVKKHLPNIRNSPMTFSDRTKS